MLVIDLLFLFLIVESLVKFESLWDLFLLLLVGLGLADVITEPRALVSDARQTSWKCVILIIEVVHGETQGDVG